MTDRHGTPLTLLQKQRKHVCQASPGLPQVWRELRSQL